MGEKFSMKADQITVYVFCTWERLDIIFAIYDNVFHEGRSYPSNCITHTGRENILSTSGMLIMGIKIDFRKSKFRKPN